MKINLLLCGIAATSLLSVTAAMATPLDAGLYTLNFVGAGRSTSEPVSVNGTGTTRTIAVNAAGGAQNITATVTTAGALHGTSSARGITMTLNGTATANAASGSFSAAQSGRTATGTFTIVARSVNIAHLPMSSNSANAESDWDKMCDWIASFLTIGGTPTPSTPSPAPGSGSTSKGLAPYVPH